MWNHLELVCYLTPLRFCFDCLLFFLILTTLSYFLTWLDYIIVRQAFMKNDDISKLPVKVKKKNYDIFVRLGMMLFSFRRVFICFWQLAKGTSNPRLLYSNQELNWSEAGLGKLVYFQFTPSPGMQAFGVTVHSWIYQGYPSTPLSLGHWTSIFIPLSCPVSLSKFMRNFSACQLLFSY